MTVSVPVGQHNYDINQKFHINYMFFLKLFKVKKYRCASLSQFVFGISLYCCYFFGLLKSLVKVCFLRPVLEPSVSSPVEPLSSSPRFFLPVI